ncbi:putative phosphoadenosine phosphosulfate reductase [Xenorhabdus bovienii str. puntauvense]|uniref:Putative phosphoadenosine phosphosulfate reductase n=1 Tax=Xenorhabdus bovienii str. puntauvense TaxID=1398201 RepID=A0A077N8Q5_XENBV|nr:phosphoadenosine phosphosulfate reductase family protein [Xenorhabdus bovienii]CDG95444.1 putative phosphoadenosine phosphosulfate reductase [Xenorhabdus bovienii str. puntauvense]
MINVVSFSGGRTSAYLVYLMEQRRQQGEDVRYVFMDTGAEHPMTYRFVREVVKFWDIPLVVLQAEMNPQLGASNGYTVWEPKDIQRMPVLKPFSDMVKKYGTPYIGGAFCTDRLKLRPFNAYCNDHFGRGNYQTWIGIRADEPRRLNRKDSIGYLADISDFDKQDVLDWWETQPFNLLIPEHLGNCVFCIKKSSKKIGLACQDEPGLKRVFESECITGKHVRDGHRKTAKEIMYRGNISLDGIAKMYSNADYQNLYQEMVAARRFDSGSCSESCEIFQPDLF